MSIHEPPPVLTSREAREELGETVRRFREGDASAQPVIFGSHRRPEAAIIPYSLYKKIVPLLEDLEIAGIARTRLAAGPAQSLDDLLAAHEVDADTPPAE